MEASGKADSEPTRMSGPARGPTDEQQSGQDLAAKAADLVADLEAQDRSADGRLARGRLTRGRLTRGRLTADRLTGGRLTSDRLAAPLARAARRGGQVGALGSRATGHGSRAAAAGARVAGRGARIAKRGAQAAGRGARSGAGRLVEQVLAIGPRLPVRDQATLRAQLPGLSPEELADALIASSARMSASVGAAVGTWAVVPFLPGIPAEVAAETLTVIGIEIKLVAELHEVFGMRAPGSLVDRMTAYTAAWANRRGVGLAPAGLVFAVGSPVRRRLQRRLAARAGESVASLGPLLTGAAAGALINRHETRRLGGEIRDDLRRRSPVAAQWAD
jgi:hypothetical protein